MNFLPETTEVLDEVRRVTGRPVRFLPDDSSPLLATLQIARRGAPEHVLRFRPSHRPLDYFIVYQAGFALRLFANPENQRFDFAGTGKGPSAVEMLMSTGVPLSAADKGILPRFASAAADWALMSLRSHAIGIRIDDWIHQTFPPLRDLQAEGIGLMQQQNANVLSQHIGSLTVPTPLLGLNAAYALFADQLLEGSNYRVPYEIAGALDDGQQLLDLWNNTPHEPAHDWALVDAWADQLGMRDWYRWIPYEP